VICVDPEHLHDREWKEITEHPIFRANILFACVDEVHLINEWGLAFRLAFGTIGTFLRGAFLLQYLLLVSLQHSSLGDQRFLSAKALASSKGTSYSSGGLTSVRIHSLPYNSSLMDSMATSFPIFFLTLQADVKLLYTAELSTRSLRSLLTSGGCNLKGQTSSSELGSITASAPLIITGRQ
jgi:hypothetical protein